MPNMSHIDDNAIAPGGLQWLTVTSNIAGLSKYSWPLPGRQS
jgi:hypothetical protein